MEKLICLSNFIKTKNKLKMHLSGTYNGLQKEF